MGDLDGPDDKLNRYVLPSFNCQPASKNRAEPSRRKVLKGKDRRRNPPKRRKSGQGKERTQGWKKVK